MTNVVLFSRPTGWLRGNKMFRPMPNFDNRASGVSGRNINEFIVELGSRELRGLGPWKHMPLDLSQFAKHFSG